MQVVCIVSQQNSVGGGNPLIRKPFHLLWHRRWLLLQTLAPTGKRCGFPFVFIITATSQASQPQKVEGCAAAAVGRRGVGEGSSCLSCRADDVLHPWQLFDVPYAYRSKCVTSFDCGLPWRSTTRRATLPGPDRLDRRHLSWYKTTGLVREKALEGSTPHWGRDGGGGSSLSRALIIANAHQQALGAEALLCMRDAASLVIRKSKLNQAFNCCLCKCLLWFRSRGGICAT